MQFQNKKWVVKNKHSPLLFITKLAKVLSNLDENSLGRFPFYQDP